MKTECHTTLFHRREFLRHLMVGAAGGVLFAATRELCQLAKSACPFCRARLIGELSSAVVGPRDPSTCPNCGRNIYSGMWPGSRVRLHHFAESRDTCRNMDWVPFPNASLVEASSKPLIPSGILHFKEGGRKVLGLPKRQGAVIRRTQR